MQSLRVYYEDAEGSEKTKQQKYKEKDVQHVMIWTKLKRNLPLKTCQVSRPN